MVAKVNPFTTQVRKLRRTLTYLRGYVDFDRHSNNVVRRTDFTSCPRPVLLLYGFMSTRRTFEVLEALGITHVINVTRELENFFPESVTYDRVPIDDEVSTDLLQHLDRTSG